MPVSDDRGDPTTTEGTADRRSAPGSDPAGSTPLERLAERRHPRELTLKVPALTLPKGGGAVAGIDEQFRVNPANGTLSLSLPLPVTPSRADLQPALSLTYDSGSGNGIVGLGWTLNLVSVRRRTDRGIPRYTDEDVFSLGGDEDLVPSQSWFVDHWQDDSKTAGPLTIRRFRPRVDRDLARIESVTELTDTGPQTWWRVITATNVTTYYGTGPSTRVADPYRPGDVFEWLPALTFDDQGNCVVYEYVAEDLVGVGAKPSERLRHDGTARFSGRYLAAAHYGNRVACAVRADEPYRPPTPVGGMHFHLVLDYGGHDALAPTLMPQNDWPVRPDSFSAFRAGFEVRIYRLLRRVLMFHEFDGLHGGEPTLVRSLDLDYATPSDGAPSLLTRATTTGHLRTADGTGSMLSAPPVEFRYQAPGWDTTVRAVDAAVGVAGFQWVDLLGEGIAGLLGEQDGAWQYAANLGDVDGTGTAHLAPPRPLASVPSLRGLGAGVAQVTELDADGRKQVVITTPQQAGYFELDADDPVDVTRRLPWLPMRPFRDAIALDLSEAHVRLLDLVGDGRVDVLVTEQDAFVWYRSAGRQGYHPPVRVPRPGDEEHGPVLVFGDHCQAVLLADMNGDGLVDVVRIRYDEVCYWPNMGYGRFGPRVQMDDPPLLDHPDSFDGRRVRLADLSGSGVTDLLYVGTDSCTAYLNLAGNGWGDGRPVARLPTGSPVDVTTSDLLGTGTAAVVWSSALPAHREAPMRYVDLMRSRKPHLLTEVINHLGRRTEVSYRSSVWFALRDAREGRPWTSRLPFPVQCVEQVETTDAVSGARRTTRYRYRHGRFDATDREFRGFGLVDEVDSEDVDLWAVDDGGHLVDRSTDQAPVLTRTWFDTGSDDDAGLERSVRAEGWQAELARAGFPAGHPEPSPEGPRVVAGAADDPEAFATDLATHLREAARACRGAMLRQEVFALDAPAQDATDDERRRQLTPYRVTLRSSMATLQQPATSARPPVYVTTEAETVTWDYERDPDDPRVQHTLAAVVDPLGHVVESASVAYPRAQVDDTGLPASTQDTRSRPHITYTTTTYTDERTGTALHRRPVVASTSQYELFDVSAAGALLRRSDLVGDGFRVLRDSTELPAPEVGTPAPDGPRHQLLARHDTVFFDDALANPLPLASQGTSGLAYESYELAFTPALVTAVFGARATDDLLTEGGYVQREGGWWVPSGRWQYLGTGDGAADALARFVVPLAHVDALGVGTALTWDTDSLLRTATTDAADNHTSAEYDLRTLAPRRVVDANGNATEVLLDALGRVKAAAMLGKGAGADDLGGLSAGATPADDAHAAALMAATRPSDLLAHASALLARASVRHIYDLGDPFDPAGARPPAAVTVKREQFAAVDEHSPVQVLIEYTDGAGRVQQAKTQAEPGPAADVTIGLDGTVTVTTVDTSTLAPPQLRWVGSGRRVLNNKGNVVKEYEPFFSRTHRFEQAAELVEVGVVRTYRYDPLDRVVRVDQPDGTFSRVEPGAWQTVEWDRNDTSKDSVLVLAAAQP